MAYVTRSFVGDYLHEDYFQTSGKSMTVHVCDDAVDTGLMDAAGVKIFRVSDRVPMGFVVAAPQKRA